MNDRVCVCACVRQVRKVGGAVEVLKVSVDDLQFNSSVHS